MAYCRKCGAQISDYASVCPECGASQDSGQNTPPVVDNGGFLWGLLGCCIPIVGLVLFLVWKDTKPRTAKAAGIGALVCVIAYVLLYVLAAVAGIGAGPCLLNCGLALAVAAHRLRVPLPAGPLVPLPERHAVPHLRPVHRELAGILAALATYWIIHPSAGLPPRCCCPCWRTAFSSCVPPMRAAISAVWRRGGSLATL